MKSTNILMKQKQILFLISFLFINLISYGQLIMSSPDVKIEDACNPNSVYAFLTEKASKKSFQEIETLLNEEIDFAKENPKFKSECAVQHIVNCKGNANTFHMVTNSKSEELDKQLLVFFKKMSDWNIVQYNDAPVDYWFMWLIKVKKGHIYVENGN